MSADTVVQVVLARLDYLLQEEGAPVTLGSDLRNMIEQLRSNLRAIDTSIISIKMNQPVRDEDFDYFNKQVIQLAYDLENAVECQALQDRISSSGGGLKTIFKLCSGKKNCSPLDSLNKRIDELKLVHFDTEIIEEGQRDQDPSRGNTSSYSGAGLSRLPREMIRTDSFLDDNTELTELLSITLSGNFQRIAIVGMGGLGMTTLARKVFNESIAMLHFDYSAWVCVSHEFRTRDVLGDILGSLYSSPWSRDEIAKMEIRELMEKIHKFQVGRRCLIVLDDVWSIEAWDTMRNAFPMHLDTVIIITTQLEQVAKHFEGHVYRIRTWTNAESLELFKKRSGMHDSALGKNVDDLIELRSMLVEGNGNTRRIVIVGMGGIEKTTLARKVFNDPIVVQHFDCQAWACVSKEFRTRDVLGDILGSLCTQWSRDEIAGMGIIELMEQLYKVQMGRKCLIVLDDVWSPDAWETMRIIFPMNYHTVVIITTQEEEVTKHFSGHVYRIRADPESWEFFKETSGLKESDSDYTPQMQDILNKLVSQCQGLPFALVAIADRLRRIKLEYWEDALRDMLHQVAESGQQKGPEILSLSYDQLPLHLKPCLLYLGQFPPDQPIPAEKLYLLWMAEGLIVSTARSSHSEEITERMNIAEQYLRDLAERSLVVIAENDQVSATKRINSCRIHNLIHDFCILQGKRDGFFEIVVRKAIERSSLTSRIVVYLDDYIHQVDDDTTSYIPEANHIRSLLFYGKLDNKSQSKSTWPIEDADLKDFQWTRVLDFDGVDFRTNKLPKNIDKLHYLRYLGFRGCYLEKLTLSFTNFLYLETLDLRVNTYCKMIIPNVLGKLSNLLHLYFPVSFQSGDQNKLIKLDGLKKLEILENFSVGICDVDDFQQFERLRIFTVLYRDGNTLDMNKIIEFINRNEYLSYTSLTLEKFDCYSKARLSILVNVLTSDAIHCLHLEGHLERMPKDLMFIGQNFTKMVFDGCEFLEDPMPILGGVKQLMTLVLCNDAIQGDEIVVPESSFEELRSLKIANMQYLENLVLESAAMQNLSILTIEQCGKLEGLPGEVMELPSLAELKIGSMSEVFLEEVRQSLEEQKDMGNDLLTATFYKCK